MAKPKPGTPGYFDQIEARRMASNAQAQYKSLYGRGPSSAEKMDALQKASRGTPAPRGGVTGILEGHTAQGTGKSKLPWEKVEKGTTPLRRGPITKAKLNKLATTFPWSDKPKPMSRTSGVKSRVTRVKAGRNGGSKGGYGGNTASRGGSRGVKGGGGAFLPGRTGFGEQ